MRITRQIPCVHSSRIFFKMAAVILKMAAILPNRARKMLFRLLRCTDISQKWIVGIDVVYILFQYTPAVYRGLPVI